MIGALTFAAGNTTPRAWAPGLGAYAKKLAVCHAVQAGEVSDVAPSFEAVASSGTSDHTQSHGPPRQRRCQYHGSDGQVPREWLRCGPRQGRKSAGQCCGLNDQTNFTRRPIHAAAKTTTRPGTTRSANALLLLAVARMIFVTELVENPIRIGTPASGAANFPAATWAAIETAVAWTSAKPARQRLRTTLGRRAKCAALRRPEARWPGLLPTRALP